MGYLMKKTSILFLLLSLCFVSCAGEDDDDGVSVGGGSGPCKGVTCSGHGTCYEIGDNLVSCNCEEGYVAEGIDCILDDGNGNGNGTDTGSDPCSGVTCSGHGNCYEKDGKPACNCEQGYDAQGTNCIEEGSSDPCAGKDCNNHGTCNPGTGQCECEEGWKGDDCENFNNGGPWSVNITGNINKNISFNKIWCLEWDNKIRVGIYQSNQAIPPYILYNLKGDIKSETKYTPSDSVLSSILEYSSSNSYGTDNVSLHIKKHIKGNVLEGNVEVVGSYDDTDGNLIEVTPKIINFKCPCIKNMEETSNNCPSPQ